MVYRPKLQEDSRVHPIFYVSLLKRALRHDLQAGHLSAGLEVELSTINERDYVLTHRPCPHSVKRSV